MTDQLLELLEWLFATKKVFRITYSGSPHQYNECLSFIECKTEPFVPNYNDCVMSKLWLRSTARPFLSRRYEILTQISLRTVPTICKYSHKLHTISLDSIDIISYNHFLDISRLLIFCVQLSLLCVDSRPLTLYTETWALSDCGLVRWCQMVSTSAQAVLLLSQIGVLRSLRHSQLPLKPRT